METFKTPHGLITLYKNETYITTEFTKGKYWDIDTLNKLKQYINPKKNILEMAYSKKEDPFGTPPARDVGRHWNSKTRKPIKNK